MRSMTLSLDWHYGDECKGINFQLKIDKLNNLLCMNLYIHSGKFFWGSQLWPLFVMSKRVITLYLVQRYVLDQPADHCSGSSLSHIDLLHIETVCIRVLLGRDYASNTQVQTRHVHHGFLLARGCLLLLHFLSSWHQRKVNTVTLTVCTNTLCLRTFQPPNFLWMKVRYDNLVGCIFSTERQTVAIHHVLGKSFAEGRHLWEFSCYYTKCAWYYRKCLFKSIENISSHWCISKGNYKKQIIVETILGICLESDLISSHKLKQSPPMTGLRAACVSCDP